MAQFPQNFTMTGQYSFRFKFRVPEIVRPSFFFACGIDKFKLAHYLKCDLTSMYGKIDLTSTSQIFLSKHCFPALPDHPYIAIEKEVHSGIFGQRKKPSVFAVTLDKSTYLLGEPIQINIDCDNSASSKQVKYIQFELCMGYLASVDEGHRLFASQAFEK